MAVPKFWWIVSYYCIYGIHKAVSAASNLTTDHSLFNMEEEEPEVHVATQFLMVVYIGTAVILSVIPFAIYIYITCKRAGAIQGIKSCIRSCRRSTTDEPDSYSDVLPWPYPRRDGEVTDTGQVFMLNLPSYEDVIKNKDFYKMSRDAKAYYVVTSEQTNRQTQTVPLDISTTDVQIQTDSVVGQSNNSEHSSVNGISPSEQSQNGHSEQQSQNTDTEIRQLSAVELNSQITEQMPVCLATVVTTGEQDLSCLVTPMEQSVSTNLPSLNTDPTSNLPLQSPSTDL